MQWVWDPAKAAENLKKHGVSFDLAERALGDPLAMTVPDPYPGEETWRTLCMPASSPAVVLVIVHTWPDAEQEPGRIISARKAEPHERRLYEDG